MKLLHVPEYAAELVLSHTSALYPSYLSESKLQHNLRREFVALTEWALGKSCYFSASQIKEFRIEKLRSLVRYAYQRLPFWREKLREVVFDVTSPFSFDEFNRLPLFTKREIQETSRENLVSEKVDVGGFGLFRVTSGSTGQPLEFFLDRRDSLLTEAIFRQAYLPANISSTDRVLNLLNPSISRTNGWTMQYGLWPSLPFNDSPVFMEQFIRIIREYDPSILIGIPSRVATLAEYCYRNNVTLNLRHISLSSEFLADEVREMIKLTFRCPIFHNYVSREFGVIAWECERHHGFHINQHWVHVEIVDDEGKPLPVGQSGNVVISNLHNRLMPFIRYIIGDRGRFAEKECACGRTYPVIEVDGRTTDFFMFQTGKEPVLNVAGIMHKEHFLTSEERPRWIKQFQFIQKRTDLVQLLIVPYGNISLKEMEANIKQLKRYLLKRINYAAHLDIQMVASIDTPPGGKPRYFVSEIV